MAIPDAQSFDVYGFRFRIRGSSPWAMEGLSGDFAFFRTAPTGQERLIEVLEEEPDCAVLPERNASVYTRAT